MKKISDANQYLEKKYNLINLDIKLNNCMISRQNGDLNDIIIIDFSIIKKILKKIHQLRLVQFQLQIIVQLNFETSLRKQSLGSKVE